MPSKNELRKFQQIVWDFYRDNRRDLPFRQTSDPYAIYVSEVMLQQTQVDRVVPKYLSFLQQFPDFKSLANAPLSGVLTQWSGLGYNRRAKFLKQAAEMIMKEYGGEVPKTAKELIALPGIGPHTAGSLLAFVHNIPHPFIETNIRRVYIHHFFPRAETIPDTDILPLVEATLDTQNPREWYYALMDYGSYLAKQTPNPNRKSKHYTRQSPFEGSPRQGRGLIIRELTTGKKSTAHLQMKLAEAGFSKTHIEHIFSGLIKEGMIRKEAKSYMLT